MPRIMLPVLAALLLLSACGKDETQMQEADQFLKDYNARYVELYYASSKAEWKSNTFIQEGDTATAAATKAANEALAAFTGSEENITRARALLEHRDALTDLQVRELEAVLYNAANNPQTVPDLVKERIDAETRQTEKLFGFNFTIDGKAVSTNDIDTRLKEETLLPARLKAWEASKEVGRELRDGLLNLRQLRNKTVQALGYDDYFSYQVSDYGMTTEEMMDMNRRLVDEIMPLYRELHTWARYELAKRYGMAKVPDYLPAHWLPNRWGQDWSSLLTVEGLDLDGVLAQKDAEWLARQGERFYVSMGFETLPQSFWEKSSLYPLPPDADYKKNNHASAWHMDLNHDVRSLMSIIPNAEWYETVHHEYGHIYYFLAYSNDDVPPLLRNGANRAFHEAVGSLLGLAAMQRPFLEHLELLPADAPNDEMQTLLKEALNYIVFLPWSAGVMTEFEHELYADALPADALNSTWWDLKKKWQGIVPPTERGEEYCDAASKTHINNDAAQYYDYALSYVILFQLHDHIAREILKQDPHATNYFGSVEVGNFLRSILTPGASVDWRKLMKDNLGEEISAKPMLRYFEPLMDYLKKANEGRKYTI
ncbi:M2 family metallopeptidase [bacterium]|nr:M2 family metallopeptidase [bacterium]